MNEELQNLIKQKETLEAELKKEYEDRDIRLDNLRMTVGPAINYDVITRIGLFIQFRKGIRNSFTEKANKIEELSYQIDLLTNNVESRQALVNAIIFLFPNVSIK